MRCASSTPRRHSPTRPSRTRRWTTPTSCWTSPSSATRCSAPSPSPPPPPADPPPQWRPAAPRISARRRCPPSACPPSCSTGRPPPRSSPARPTRTSTATRAGPAPPPTHQSTPPEATDDQPAQRRQAQGSRPRRGLRRRCRGGGAGRRRRAALDAACRGRLGRHPDRHRLPDRGQPGLAGCPAVLARPPGRGDAHRTHARGGRRQPAQTPTRPPRIQPPPRRGQRPPRRPHDGCRDRGRRRAGRTPRPRPGAAVSGRHVPDRARPTRDDLIQAVAEVRAAAASVLLDTQPATWRQLQGWTSTLPLGHDGLGMRRVFDTDALAMAFPLGSADVPAPLPGQAPPAGGVLYGHNTDSAGIVWWDRWSQHNHNSVILARSGAGKSYLIKLEILRSLYDRIAVAVIDPEDEYPRLAAAIGGTILRLGAPGVRLNPFDIPPADCRRDALVRRQLFLHTLISVLLSEPVSPAVLDKAVHATYDAAGINNDPATWTRPAPLLRDLAATLARSVDPAAQILADRLSPWTQGSFKDLFDGPSTVTPSGQLVVWSTRLLPDELRPAGMLLALDAIWRDVDAPTSTAADLREGRPPQVQRRLVVVDEAWTLLRDGEGARFLNRLAKAARKRHAGLSVVTQDAADVLGTDLGRAVVSNAATQILMRQAPQAIEAITAAFALTAGEARVLLAAGKGQGLLLGGSLRCGFQVVASPREHLLCATGIADMGEPDGDGEDASWAA